MVGLFLAVAACETHDAPPLEESPAPVAPSPADEIAQRIANRSGDPYALAELRFTFVVERDGAEVARRSHLWCPAERVVQVNTAEGVQWAPTDARPAAEGPAAAYEAFVNDGYWLFAASKVFDPGVTRAIDEGDLRLTFQDVGVTPGDTYWFEANSDGEVRGWRFRLESGSEGRFDFSDYQDVGGLHVALRKTSEHTVIRFEDVAAAARCSITPRESTQQ